MRNAVRTELIRAGLHGVRFGKLNFEFVAVVARQDALRDFGQVQTQHLVSFGDFKFLSFLLQFVL